MTTLKPTITCTIKIYGDTTICETCKQRWDTGDFESALCGLPLRIAAKLDQLSFAWGVALTLFAVAFFSLGFSLGIAGHG
jgi:hypothetical protein